MGKCKLLLLLILFWHFDYYVKFFGTMYLTCSDVEVISAVDLVGLPDFRINVANLLAGITVSLLKLISLLYLFNCSVF